MESSFIDSEVSLVVSMVHFSLVFNNENKFKANDVGGT